MSVILESRVKLKKEKKKKKEIMISDAINGLINPVKNFKK